MICFRTLSMHVFLKKVKKFPIIFNENFWHKIFKIKIKSFKKKEEEIFPSKYTPSPLV